MVEPPVGETAFSFWLCTLQGVFMEVYLYTDFGMCCNNFSMWYRLSQEILVNHYKTSGQSIRIPSEVLCPWVSAASISSNSYNGLENQVLFCFKR